METCCKASARWSDGDLGGWTLVLRLLFIGQMET